MLRGVPVSPSLVAVPTPTKEKLGGFTRILTSRRINRRSRELRVCAQQRDNQFEIDRDKAREALKMLDEQLLNLSQKEIPKARFTRSVEADIKRREPIAARLGTEDEPDVSGSYLGYAAVFLVIITVVNNIAFNIFIKPSVDGEGPPAASLSARLLREEMQQAPPP